MHYVKLIIYLCPSRQSGLADLHEYVYSDYSRLHVRYKLTTWLRGLIPSPFMRPPMPKPREEEITQLRSLVEEARLSPIPDSEIHPVINALPL